MSAKETAEKLALLRANLHSQHLDSGQQQRLQEAVDDLELKLQAAQPPDPEAFEDQVLAWETRMSVEHPVLSSVISEALRKLSAMGI